MIKRVYLYSLLVYFVTMVVIYIWNIGRHFEWSSLAFMACTAVVLAGIGLFIGVFLCAVFQRPTREKWLYGFGQLLPFGFMIFALFSIMATSDKTKPKTANQENEQYVAGNGAESPQVRIAFESLKSQFTDPNDFKIETYLAVMQDTVIHFRQDSLWTITIAYSLQHAKFTERYATFVVQGNKVRMIRFNEGQYEPEFIRITKQIESIEHCADSVKKACDVK